MPLKVRPQRLSMFKENEEIFIYFSRCIDLTRLILSPQAVDRSHFFKEYGFVNFVAVDFLVDANRVTV